MILLASEETVDFEVVLPQHVVEELDQTCGRLGVSRDELFTGIFEHFTTLPRDEQERILRDDQLNLTITAEEANS